MATSGWAMNELRTVDLGDPRRVRRTVQVLEQMSRHPAASLPQTMESWAATKAAYRLLDNVHTDAAAIMAGHGQATRERAAGAPVLLAIQDTTQLDFTSHPALAGTGPLSGKRQRGVLLHSTLLTDDDGLPLGIIDHQCWARDPARAGSRHTRRQRPTAEKESQRWLDAAARIWTDLADLTTPVILICDREGDIFDLFAQARPAWGAVLVRSTHDRKLADATGSLRETVAAAPVLGNLTVELGRRGDQLPRPATLALRATRVTLAPPHKRPGAGVPVTVVLATEVPTTPLPDNEPLIEWMLTTTLDAASAEGAAETVRRYTQRWQIERYHYVLKQGCAVEALQLTAVARLERALALYAIVAWHLLWLTYLGRRRPDAPCTIVLTTSQWQTLWLQGQRGKPLPDHPPTVAEAIRLIARLGGFLARRGDGEPGVKTIWRGWQRLHDLHEGLAMAHMLASQQTCG